MSGFKRSPSKVWWNEEAPNWRLYASSSPGSQDSGFSDTEASPPGPVPEANVASSTTPKKECTPQRIPRDIFKRSASTEDQNLNSSFREKSLQDKSISLKLHFPQVNSTFDVNRLAPRHAEFITRSEPPKRHLYQKNSKTVSKNLFNDLKASASDQYAKDRSRSDISSEVTFENNEYVSKNCTLPLTKVEKSNCDDRLNSSAPAVLEVLRENEDSEGFTSDSDSELEELFQENIESPPHTSTPNMRHCRRKTPLHLRAKYHQQRLPPVIRLTVGEENGAVRKWSQDMRFIYESECMTALQCKSIAAELNQKVLTLATKLSSSVRHCLADLESLEKEFQNLQKESKYVGPLAQNLAGMLSEFLEKQGESRIINKALKECDALRRNNNLQDIPVLTSSLYNIWKLVRHDILTKEVAKLAEKLENPTSELDVRATITAITSLSLRHEFLIDFFVQAGVVPTMLVLCEKCEGSSVRSLILRALTTMCSNGMAVRQLEKGSGVQLIADTLEESSRPEPELSESVALLAQITAPWVEDSHRLRGIHEEGKKLVRALTRFLSTTKCCQNLLLCTAALANITCVEPRCVKYVLAFNSIKVIFNTVRNRGPRASIYLFEQVATLLANISSTEEARMLLVKENAAAVLLCFLQTVGRGDEVHQRLQQKTVIAMSRLCSHREAAEQIVEIGGINKLVKLCREKEERFNNDAVLVAALATLRKIVDACGTTVINVQDAQELVEPKLLDSFLAYSTQNESYV